jgi:Alpha/beta hydrolase family
VSADGTMIAFTTWGAGEPLVIVDGAAAYPAINPLNEEIGRLLGDEFGTYAYDRRGRGQSTDTAPYAVEREIEDLAALIDVAGGPATVFGWSSSGVLALDAAAAGLPITRLALFEPPFVVDDSRPPLPADDVQRLDAAVADGRPGGRRGAVHDRRGRPARRGRQRHPAERVLADHVGRRADDRLRRSDHGNHDVRCPTAPSPLARRDRCHAGDARHRDVPVHHHRRPGAGRPAAGCDPAGRPG